MTRMYHNVSTHDAHGGVININRQYTYSPLEELLKHCSHSAGFDSAARFDPPRCVESTRLEVIHLIEEWMKDDGDGAMPSSIFWLFGGAGVGKSALAQSLSEKYQEKKQLAASFFFFRSDAGRNNGDLLIPTIVSHLVNTFEGITPFVEDKIGKDRLLFNKRYQIQFQELFVEPLIALKSTGALITHPRLFIIDGLDECENKDAQSELLRVIARALPHIPYPLRFLITSRPQTHITHAFNHGLPNISVHRYNLSDDPDADVDIRRFLGGQFDEILRVHPLRRHLPDAWPSQQTITSLVERSSGQFIYASTVIRFIRSPEHRPDDRLQVILGLRPPQERDRPYAQLDSMYRLIFLDVQSPSQLEKIYLVLGFLYFHRKRAGLFSRLVPDCTTIEGFLGMKVGDLILLLDPIISLIAIDGDQVRVLHEPLFEYLLDSTRSEDLGLDLARVHESVANYILKQKIVQVVCDWTYFPVFAYHCQYAFLNDTLKDYLHALNVPSPKSGATQLENLLGDDLDSFLRSILWLLLRTLSREDFDTTGQLYKKFAASWIRSLVPRHTPLLQKVDNFKYWLKPKLDIMKSSSVTVASEVDDLKRKLDALLMEWKPSNSNTKDVGTSTRFAFIKQEHKIFSAYATASFSGTIVSSLVPCDEFIHSYDVGIRDKESFLALRTYSSRGKACYQNTFVGCHDVVGKTQDYLTMVEAYLRSDLYQNYGLEPEGAGAATPDVKFSPVNYFPAVSNVCASD